MESQDVLDHWGSNCIPLWMCLPVVCHRMPQSVQVYTAVHVQARACAMEITVNRTNANALIDVDNSYTATIEVRRSVIGFVAPLYT